VHKNAGLIVRHRPQVVLILAGDRVYPAAYEDLIDAHLERRADVTVLSGHIPAEDASAFGVLQVSSERRVARFDEKPCNPRPYAVDGQCPINLGVYCFDPEFLARRLLADAGDSSSLHDFGKDILTGAFGGEPGQ
jgi:glucose-1-phosphate adenylyltransferase